MGKEIERKFLVKDLSYKKNVQGALYRQGYLSREPERVVRIRIIGSKGIITIKGKTKGITRLEFEYEIPHKDADEMLNNLCVRPILEKHRFKCEYQGFVWEVDEFHGENEGLIVAEIELAEEDTKFTKPEWVGEEVTYNPRYYNSTLVVNPYKSWKE